MKTWLLVVLLLWQGISRAEPMLPAPATGATVDESRVETTLYVDPANAEAADDDKHGTADAPFATFRHGCEVAAKAKDANKGVKLILANGTYRETASIPPPPGGKDTEAPLIIEAAERDQAIIDGADTEGWTPSTWKVEDGRWTHPWTFPRTDAAVLQWRANGKGKSWRGTGAAAIHWGDLLIVNDLPLRRVENEAELVPGSYWVGASQPGQEGRVVAQPPDGAELVGAIIQIGARSGGLTINGRRHVVVRGLMFQHAANPASAALKPTDPLGVAPWEYAHDTAGLRLSACNNAVVEDVLCQWNDGGGIVVSGGANVSLRRVRILHNGGTGISVVQVRNLLAEDCESSFNDFRMDWDKTIQFNTALRAEGEGMTWRRLRAVGNFGPAVSLAGIGVTLEEGVIADNMINGLAATGAGPLLIRRCVVSGTKRPADGKELGASGGITLTSAADATLQSNIVAENAGAQLVVNFSSAIGAKGHAARHTYRHNVFTGAAPDQLLCLWQEPDTSLPGSVGADYRALDTDENCFWNPAQEAAFQIYRGHPPFPARPITRVQPSLTFEKWREWLAAHVTASGEGPEAHSRWQNPAFVDPVEGDFRLKENSPVSGWELPSDESANTP